MLAGEPPQSAGLDEVILRRMSTRSMDPSWSVAGDVFEWSLGASLRESRLPHFIAVHAVEGFEPGLYRYPSVEAPVRRGDLRDELLRVCDRQGLSRDASFVLVAAVDADQLDDHGYRAANLTDTWSPAACGSPPSRWGSAPPG
jgi:hypothetical protein